MFIVGLRVIATVLFWPVTISFLDNALVETAEASSVGFANRFLQQILIIITLLSSCFTVLGEPHSDAPQIFSLCAHEHANFQG